MFAQTYTAFEPVFILNNIEKISSVKLSFYKVYVANKDKLREVITKEKNIAVVIHFAISKALGESVIKSLKYFRNNFISLTKQGKEITHKIEHNV